MKDDDGSVEIKSGDCSQKKRGGIGNGVAFFVACKAVGNVRIARGSNLEHSVIRLMGILSS